MRFGHLAPQIAAFLIALAGPAQGQSSPSILTTRPLQFESWVARAPVEVGNTPNVGGLVEGSRNRTRQALLGGVIGAATGVVVCTAFSTLIDDSAEGGVSFCPLDTNLLFGGAGFVLGALIGWSI